MQNTMEAVIVHPNCLLPSRMMADNDQVRIVIQSMVNWRNEMLQRPKPERTSFHDRRRPGAFAVAVPLLGGGQQAWTIGICKRCVDKGDAALLQKVVERLRAYYPDLTDIGGGWPRLGGARTVRGAVARILP